MTDPQENFIRKLKESKVKYINNLPSKISEIKLLWNQLNNNEWRLAVLQKMISLSHNLAGSGGTFGIPLLSSEAKNLELALSSLQKYRDTSPPDEEKNLVEDLLIALQAVELETIRDNDPVPTPLNRSDLVFILDDDVKFSLDLSRQLMYYGCSTKVVNDINALEKNLKNVSPLVIIIDTAFAQKQLAQHNVVQTLRKEWMLTCPMIFISTRDDFESRMQAIKSSASAYFTKPADTALLVERINILTNSSILEPYRILIIEDDEDLANYYALTLQKAGLKVYVETKPELALNRIMQLNPELVVMDLYMPNYNGIDLVTMIRQHQSLLTLPIVLLTSETDINLQFLAREVGVDDFLSKPIEPSHLLDAVLNRVQRARYMNVSMNKDSLTGLYVHKKINEYLKLQLSISERYHRTFSYAILDIDNFKQINDTYGHLVGDNVLISLANLLKTRIRASDFVGRYGGEEFVVILTETDENAALLSLERLRQEFANITHYASEQTFHVTFSAGIASYPNYADADTLMAKADEALYDSKNSGKNKITIA